MDLSTIDIVDAVNAGVPMHLRGPDGVPLFDGDGDDKKPITITLLGEDSKAVTKINNITTNAYLRGGQAAQITAEQAREKEIAKLARATVGWSGIELDGKEYPYDEEAAKALYRRLPWVRDQVGQFIRDRANFTKASR